MEHVHNGMLINEQPRLEAIYNGECIQRKRERERESNLMPTTTLKSSSIDLLMYLWKLNLLFGAK